MYVMNNAKQYLAKAITSKKAYLSIIFGLFSLWLFKTSLLEFVHNLAGFQKPNLLSEFIILFVFSSFLTILFFILLTGLDRFFNKKNKNKKLSSTIIFMEKLKASENHINMALLIITIGFCSVFFINNILSRIDTTTWSYVVPKQIPTVSPVGYDFRIGEYQPAFHLVASNFTQITSDGSYFSIYPPLVHLIFVPYLLFNENTAYLIHVGFLFFANLACLAIVSIMAKEFILDKLKIEKIYSQLISLFLFFSLLIYTFSSYSFDFSIERGQTDIFALLFSLLAVFVLLKKPKHVWVQVALLSIAVHLKIYPVVIFLLLFVKHGRKLFLPAITINLIFLFILGPSMACDFLQSLTSGSGIGAGIGNRWTWVGNHSAYSFADTLARESLNYSLNLYILWPILTLIAIELWFVATYILFKNYSSQNAVLFFMVSISIMDLVPTISMDYRLVILSSAALLLLALILKRIIDHPSFFDYFQLGLVMLILLFIGRPYAMSDSFQYGLRENASFFINNKFLWSLALEAIMVWNIFNNKNGSEIELNTIEV